MKHILLIAALILIVGCTSKIGKAEKIIDNYISKTIDDDHVYEPISTEIDTVFDIPYYRQEIIDLADETFSCIKQMHNIQRKEGMAIGDACISWGISSPSVHIKKAERYHAMAEALNTEIERQLDSLQMLASQCTGNPDRWGFRHKYRLRNRIGNAQSYELYLVTDLKVKEPLFWLFQNERYENALKVIDKADTLSTKYRMPSPVK